MAAENPPREIIMIRLVHANLKVSMPGALIQNKMKIATIMKLKKGYVLLLLTS